MARRWLLTVLTGMALSVGLAGTASAQELDDPLTVDAEVVTVSATVDATARTVEADATTDVELADADADPAVTVAASPDGPAVDTDGGVEVAGTEVSLSEAAEPVEETLEGPAPAPTQDQGAAGDGIRPAPAPASAPAGPAGPAGTSAEPRTVEHSRVMSADSAAVRSGLRAETADVAFDANELAPQVAPPAETPLVAAAAPAVPTDLGLPLIDGTPTVPGVLRLLAGLLVVGAAVTWRTVRNELA